MSARQTHDCVAIDARLLNLQFDGPADGVRAIGAIAEIPQPMPSVNIRYLHIKHQRNEHMPDVQHLNGGHKATRYSFTDIG